MQFFTRRVPGPGSVSGVQANQLVREAKPFAVPPKTRGRRRSAMWILALVALALIMGVSRYWKAKSEFKRSEKTTGLSAPTAVVSIEDLQATARVTGTVVALNSASMLAPRILGSRTGMNRGGDTNSIGGPGSAPAGGGGGGADFNLVLRSLAKPGARVKAGDMVAQFDPQNQLLRLDDYKDSAIQLENSVQSMVASMDSLKEAHDQAVRAAKSAWDESVLDLQTAPVHADIDVEKFKLAVEEAEATYKQLVYESSLVEESQRAQVRISELNRDQSRIELQRAEANVQKMTIKTPIDGIVVMATIVRNGEFGQIREGDQVNPGQPCVSVVDPNSMILNATVNQVDAERLRLGMKAIIRVDAYPVIELPGTLTGVGAMAKTSTFRQSYVAEVPVRIKIEGTDPRIIPDLSGSAEIVMQSARNAVVVPRAAVFQDNGASFVFMKSTEGWIRKPVHLGLANFTSVAVDSGLERGDVVALQPPM